MKLSRLTWEYSRQKPSHSLMQCTSLKIVLMILSVNLGFSWASRILLWLHRVYDGFFGTEAIQLPPLYEINPDCKSPTRKFLLLQFPDSWKFPWKTPCLCIWHSGKAEYSEASPQSAQSPVDGKEANRGVSRHEGGDTWIIEWWAFEVRVEPTALPVLFTNVFCQALQRGWRK